jgi:hypothetical protein
MFAAGTFSESLLRERSLNVCCVDVCSLSQIVVGATVGLCILGDSGESKITLPYYNYLRKMYIFSLCVAAVAGNSN